MLIHYLQSKYIIQVEMETVRDGRGRILTVEREECVKKRKGRRGDITGH